MTPHTVTAQWWDHATLWNAADPHLEDAGHTTDGGRVFGITRLRYDECDDYGCKPVVVISPEDREQVEALFHMAHRTPADLAAALREFANPTPPKPDEPLGLGAVVEDAEGIKWVRSPSGAWHGGGKNYVAGYFLLDAVRVLSEGVTP